jgi:hypothetical protein
VGEIIGEVSCLHRSFRLLMAGNQRLYHKQCLNTKGDMGGHHLKGSSNGGNLQGGTISRLSMMYVLSLYLMTT